MIAEIAGAVLAVTQTGVITWLVVGRVRAADAVADARVAQSDTEAHFERAQFELEITNKALAAANARAAALEGVLRDAQQANPGAGLDAADWHSRLVRLSEAWASDTGNPLPAGDDGAVPSSAAAASPRAAEMPAGSATVR